MRIGRKIKEVTEEPRPVRVRPIPATPIREPVAVPVSSPSRESVPLKAFDSELVGRDPYGAYTVEEIPYSCPHCGRELVMEEDILICPDHGVVYID